MFPGARNPGGELAELMLATSDAADARLRFALEERDAAVSDRRADAEQEVLVALDLKRQVHNLARDMSSRAHLDEFAAHNAALLRELEVDLQCCPSVVTILEMHQSQGEPADAAQTVQAESKGDGASPLMQRSRQLAKTWASAGLSALALLLCLCGCLRRVCGSGAEEVAPRKSRRKSRRGYARELELDEDQDGHDGDDDDDILGDDDDEPRLAPPKPRYKL